MPCWNPNQPHPGVLNLATRERSSDEGGEGNQAGEDGRSQVSWQTRIRAGVSHESPALKAAKAESCPGEGETTLRDAEFFGSGNGENNQEDFDPRKEDLPRPKRPIGCDSMANGAELNDVVKCRPPSGSECTEVVNATRCFFAIPLTCPQWA